VSAFECPAVIGFKNSQAGVEQFTLRDDHDVEARCDLVPTKNLSYQSFRAVSTDRAPQLAGRGDAEPRDVQLVGGNENCRVAAAEAAAAVVDVLKFRALAQALVTPESLHPSGTSGISRYSLLTVRRLRPLARRRFSTRRPFFELIRTRNPWVRFRRRELG
jgi:hypothetical protein